MNNRAKIKLLAWICAALGWWGIIYPEFTLTSDTCRIVDEAGRQVASADGSSGVELYSDILRAGTEYIHPRSRLLSVIAEISKD
ncbi:MAG: hypothetical protein LUG83_02945 [Lachnospiraceae bacterium]|nr:hypothetical protein [Lachnospiraceae bacterium]